MDRELGAEEPKPINFPALKFSSSIITRFLFKQLCKLSLATQPKMGNQEPLRVLLIGKGGRESALAVRLSQSPIVERIFVVPGNGGTARGIEEVSNIDNVSYEDFEGLVKLAKELQVNWVLPGRFPISLSAPSSCVSLPFLHHSTDLFRAGCTNLKWY